MRVLVTGASGFIGSRLVRALCDAGYQVRILSRKDPAAFELEPNEDVIEFVQVDLLDSAFEFETVLADCSVVFNCAGELHDESLMQPLHVDATFRLVQACKKVAIATGQPLHYVQLSSVGAYGPSTDKASVERIVTEATIPAPVGVYEITKTRADEHIVHAEEKGIFSYSILRPSNVYGPGMPNNSIRQWGRIIKKKLFFYVGTPCAIATYVHVDDVVDALMLCGFDARAKGQIFNISNDCSQESVVDAMAKALNVSTPTLRVPEHVMRFVVSSFSWIKGFPVSHSRVDALVSRTHYPVSKLASVLDYRPTRAVEETIGEVLCDRSGCSSMNDAEHKLQGIKVARVSTVAFFVETQLHAQISNIVQAGAQVTVVASEAAPDREISGSCYVSIEIPRKIELFRDFSALLKLWLFFRRSDFDIVHSTTPKAGLLCCLAAKLAGVPVRLHTFTGQPWVSLTGVKRFLSKSSDKLISRLNTHCYADSSSQKNFIVKSGIASPEQIGVLGSGSLAGINLERFNPLRFSESDKEAFKAKLGIASTASVLLFVGRLSRDKGLAELLAAFQRTIAENVEAFLILLGPLETDIESSLEGLTDAIRAKIIMPGFSSEPERFMAIADILILPSYREGFGTVIIEAAAMGVPAIGTNIYGLSDAIIAGKTGLLVPVKRIDELAAAIITLLGDPGMRLEMGRNARERVEIEFSSMRVSGLVIDEYVDLLRASKRLQ